MSVVMLQTSEKEKATHSSILAWEMSCMGRGAWWAIVHGVFKVLYMNQRPKNNDRDIHFSTYVEGRRKSLWISITDTDFCVQCSNNLLIHLWHFAFFLEFIVFGSQSFFLCCKLLPLYLALFFFQFCPQGDRLLLSRERQRDSWPLEESNSIWGQ